jgi:hypothetical protein
LYHKILKKKRCRLIRNVLRHEVINDKIIYYIIINEQIIHSTNY